MVQCSIFTSGDALFSEGCCKNSEANTKAGTARLIEDKLGLSNIHKDRVLGNNGNN